MVGVYDFDITVGEDGDGQSDIQNTFKLSTFAVKCDDAATWSFQIVDKDNFPVFDSTALGVLLGPQAIPVDRRCAKFRLKIIDATPGTYSVRAQVD